MSYPKAVQELLLRFWSIFDHALINREVQFLDDHVSYCFPVYICDWGCVGPGLGLGWLNAGLALALCWAVIGS